jgi:dTDP-4-amino-4,6-dideoxygalactose transaminase
MKNIQLFRPKFRNKEITELMNECFDKGWTGLGFKTQELEESWKKYTGLKNAHFLNSNTSGLHLALKILKDANKWNDGDEIITSPLTFVSSNHAIMYENLKPVFADVDEYLCLDAKSVEDRITKKTKAVVFIGIGGNAGKLDEVIGVCKKHGLKIILDAAHMSGTFVKDYYDGGGYTTAHVGFNVDVSVFSFQAVKNLPTADSGMICFKNDDYDQLVRKLSWLGISKDTYQRSNDKGNYKWEYDLVDVGYKYHGNSIMASMGIVGLKYLEVDNKRRREICDIYDKAFDRAGVKSIKVSPYTEVSSRHLYQIVVKNRNNIMEYLNNQGVYPGVHYRDNTHYKMYNDQFGKCPVSQNITEELISLPLHMYLSDDDINYVIEKVIEANKKYN